MTLCTISTFIVTSDNPVITDEDWWHGFHLSFSLVITFMLVIIAAYSFKFGANLKREPVLLESFYKFFTAAIIFLLINYIFSDTALWSTNIRRFWALVITIIEICVPVTLVGLPILSILMKYLISFIALVFGKIFCSKQISQPIKADDYEAAEAILKEMENYEEEMDQANRN